MDYSGLISTPVRSSRRLAQPAVNLVACTTEAANEDEEHNNGGSDGVIIDFIYHFASLPLPLLWLFIAASQTPPVQYLYPDLRL